MGSFSGAKAVHFTVPSGPPGSYRVYAVGQHTRATTYAVFKIK